ncbi:hypoxanthine phosphoribosyltransferase [Adhaeribacter sp. BT258]|uniref:Hypoxanthine phosphoribosyltransferase n=1 Tax=Adhaeribacter terrigena TaxID=2793070 RepID=A0ABS1BX63_9BACT|nr:hypoxanthine phosphoribosyltransferase [Adhaeribacter terrigena]MBK0401734.1 hypoxanthine phosphoribosyltransferase [Adhaeribacter terrigena]
MAAQTVTLHDKSFGIYLPESEILSNIKALADRINQDYASLNPLFVAVLNGSFMFAADLLKEVTVPCEISFMKVASYENTSSTGQVTELVGLKEEIAGRHLVILEDIVDTGNTVVKLLDMLGVRNPASIEIATLLQKPECLQHKLDVKYTGREIPNDFVVGYGLDYNGLGRNLRDIYKVI